MDASMRASRTAGKLFYRFVLFPRNNTGYHQNKCRTFSINLKKTCSFCQASFCGHKNGTLRQHLSSLAALFQGATEQRSLQVFRTHQDDPTHHSLAQEGLLYRLPEADVTQLFKKGLSVQFVRQANSFNETCVMVRRPALEVISCLKHLDLSNPAPRFLLYGGAGAGKTMTIAHILHFCYRNDWLIVHAPWPFDWNCRYSEKSPSAHKSGRIDLPMEAAEWLVCFRSQNTKFLKDIKTINESESKYCASLGPPSRKWVPSLEKTSQRYVWTKREAAEPNTSLSEIIEFGLGRIKFASDCVGVILRELRQQAAMEKIKLLVAVDGVNAFWNLTNIKNSERELLPADHVSLVYNFKKMLLSNWTHGAIVCSVDGFANPRDRRESPYPYYLLGKEGYQCLDPFIPVPVPNYSEKEAYRCVEYYCDRNWIQHPQVRTEDGKKQLLFLSNKNPFQLMRICSSK